MEPLLVHSLIGKTQVDYAITCLSSLHRTSVEPVTFSLHDDGTLTPDDMKRLLDCLPVSALVSRKESDERVNPLLKDYPHCLKFRQQHFVAIKLFDVTFLGPPEVYYCDTDIIFLAPHRHLFAGALDQVDSVFSFDLRNSYALLPWHLRPFSHLVLQARVCAGLFSFRRSAFDLEFLENYLATFWDIPVFQERMWAWEQTGWSALAARTPSLAYDPVQIGIPFPPFRYDPRETIAIHCVNKKRHKIAEFDHRQREKEEPKDIRLVKSYKVNPVVWLGEKFAGNIKARLMPEKPD
jgi:hypothetical protein